MNKVFLFALVGITVVVLGLYLYFNDREFVVTISEVAIKEKLDERLPISKKYLFVFEVSLDNPRVDLDSENNRISIGLDVQLNIRIDDNDKPLGGSVDVSGTIRYAPDEGAFYLSKPIIEKLLIVGLAERYTSKASKIVEKALINFYSGRPIYTLNSSNMKQGAAKMILKNLVVKEKNIVLTLGI